MGIKWFISDSLPLVFMPKKSATENKISSFSSYPDKWSYGRGIQFSKDVIEDASRIVKLFHNYGFLETDAFPGEGGEIMITAYKDKFCCEIITHEDLQYDFVIEKNDTEIKREESISFNRLNNLVTEFRDLIVCRSSELLTQGTLIQEEKGSPVWLSEIPAIKGEFQLLTKTVSDKQPAAFANISTNTTQMYQVIRSFSGHSLLTRSHQHIN